MGETPNFKGGAVFPFGAIWSAEQGWVFENGAGGGVDDGEDVLWDDGVVGVADDAGVGDSRSGGGDDQLWVGR